MNDEWFYHNGKSPVGPYDFEALKTLLAKDIITVDTLVAKSGTSDWVKLQDRVEDRPNRNIDEKLFPGDISPSHLHELPISDVLISGAITNADISKEEGAWLSEPVTPWRRWAARCLDISFNGILFFYLFGIAFFSVAPNEASQFFSAFEGKGGKTMDILISSFVACIISGLVTGLTGFSLGKLIFGVKVVDTDMQPIGAFKGVLRDLEVWIKGLGLGLPLISLITSIAGFYTLKREGVATWDNGKYLVLHRRSGVPQYMLNVLGVALWIALIAYVQFLNRSQ